MSLEVLVKRHAVPLSMGLVITAQGSSGSLFDNSSLNLMLGHNSGTNPYAFPCLHPGISHVPLAIRLSVRQIWFVTIRPSSSINPIDSAKSCTGCVQL